jgi:dihydrofolate reductase
MVGLGLIDELYLVVHPVLVGENKRLFQNFLVPEKLNFQLGYTQRFKSGVIALHYQKMNKVDLNSFDKP